MSRAVPGVPRAEFSKVERSRLILSGTGAISCLALAAWLALAALVPARLATREVVAMTLAAPEGIPADPSRAEAAGTRYASLDGPGLLDRLREFLSERDGPAIVSLTATGVTVAAPSGQPRAYLVPADGNPSDPESLVAVDELVETLRANATKSAPVLLVLDASPVTTDPGLGVFGTSLPRWIEPLLSPDDAVLVMASCAPGQSSWSADPYPGSVFSACVSDGLSQSSMTASRLLEFVRPRVASWVREHRDGAVQTPVLLGNVRRFDFRLPRVKAKPLQLASAALADDAPERKALAEAWKQHDTLSLRHPEHRAPLSWRAYRAKLLEAQDQLRRGQGAETALSISVAEALSARVIERLDEKPDIAWSIASSGAASTEKDALLAAVEDLFQGRLSPLGENPAPAPDSPPPAAPDSDAPADPAAPPEAAAPKQEPAAAIPLPVDPLGGIRESDLAEVRLARRYVEFARLGGEDGAARPTRLPRLDQAWRVAVKAEQAGAAVDPGRQNATVNGRLLAWIRPLASRLDRARLEAQDSLFANRPRVIESSTALLSEADRDADAALLVLSQVSPAVDLLHHVQADAPFLGDWLVRRDKGLGPLADALSQATALADLLDHPPASPADLAAEAAKVDAAHDRLSRTWQRLTTEFDAEVRRLRSGPDKILWRDIDALVRVPMLPAADREVAIASLSKRPSVEAPGLSGSFSASDGTDEPAEDEAFWTLALGSAQLEVGLLSLAGLPAKQVDQARSDLATVDSMRQTNPDAAFDALDSFSDAVRRLRATPVDQATLDSIRDGEPKLEDAWRIAAAADRASRVLPAAELRRLLLLDSDPTEARESIDRHALLVWNADRAANDLALVEARRLIDAARALRESPERQDVAKKIAMYAGSGGLRIEQTEVSPGRVKVKVESRGELPAGRAVVILEHEPSTEIRVTTDGDGADDAGAMIPIPLPTPVERALVLSNPSSPRDLPAVAPTVFYRGRTFALPDRVAVQPLGDLVSVSLQQQFTVAKYTERGRSRSVKIADQFEAHPTEGYLHPNSDLAYKVALTNNTPERLNLVVVSTLAGKPPLPPVRLTLDAGATDNVAVGGKVASFDFTKPGEPVGLKVEVFRDRRDGTPLCEPKEFAFRLLDPGKYVGVTLAYNAPFVYLRVDHMAASPVYVPTLVTVQVEPLNAVRQVGRVQEWIGHGDYRFYKYWILDHEVPELTFRLKVDGQEMKLEPVALKMLPKALPGVEPPPAAPAGVPPAAPEATP